MMQWYFIGGSPQQPPTPVYALLTDGSNNVYVSGGQMSAPTQLSVGVPNGWKADLGNLAIAADGRWMAVYSDDIYGTEPTVVQVVVGDESGEVAAGSLSLPFSGINDGLFAIGAMAYGTFQIATSEDIETTEDVDGELVTITTTYINTAIWQVSDVADGSLTLTQAASASSMAFSYLLNPSTIIDASTFTQASASLIDAVVWKADLSALIDEAIFDIAIFGTPVEPPIGPQENWADISNPTGLLLNQSSTTWVGDTVYVRTNTNTDVLAGTVEITQATVTAGDPYTISDPVVLDTFTIPAPADPTGWTVRAVQYRPGA